MVSWLALVDQSEPIAQPYKMALVAGTNLVPVYTFGESLSTVGRCKLDPTFEST